MSARRIYEFVKTLKRCVRCFEQARPGRTLCVFCAAVDSELHRERYKVRAGLNGWFGRLLG